MKGAANVEVITKPSIYRAPEDILSLGQNKQNMKRKVEVVITRRSRGETKRAQEAAEKEPEVIKEPVVSKTPSKVALDKINNTVPDKIIEVPYLGVPPLAEVTRQDRPKILEKDGPAYKNVAPVERVGLTAEIVKRLLEAPLHATVGDILGLAPDVRKEVIKQASKVRKSDNTKSTQLTATVEEIPESDDDEDEEIISEQIPEPEPISAPPIIIEPVKINPVNIIVRAEDLPAATFTILVEDSDIGPKGAILVSDPISQYLESIPPEDRHRVVIAARDVEGLRTIFPDINKKGSKESVLDPGSQVVSMSKKAAAEVGMGWDGSLTMGMEGCHGDVESTLGIARNVPFEIGGITLILQVHIVDKAPYEVLLGRPFDVLGRTIVTNSADGDQLITITDPVSGQKLTFPTFERGKAPPGVNQGRQTSFQASKI